MKETETAYLYETEIAQVKELYATFEGREKLRRFWMKAHPDSPLPYWLEEEEPVESEAGEAIGKQSVSGGQAVGKQSTGSGEAAGDEETVSAEPAPALGEEPMPWGPLPGREPPGPFPLDALPELGRQVAVTVADSVQVSPGMSACMVLGALSAAACGRAGVRVAEDYEEPCHLYIAIGANPSERKSACMKLVFSSLYRYEKEEDERRAPAVRHYEETVEMLKEQLARAKKAGERQQVADLIDEMNGMEEVRPYELILTDATPEALTRTMAQNGGRMAVVSAEGVFFSTLAGGYSSSGVANVDVVLKGYSGEPVKVERIGRAKDRIARACLSLCLAVQPDMLIGFLTDPNLAGRGMASRFLAAMPRSRVGAREDEGIPVDMALMERFAQRLERILREPDPVTLTLSPPAKAARKAWFKEVEEQLNPGGSLANLAQGWGGKLCGNTVRIAGLLQLLADDSLEIGGEAMKGAVRIARWFRDQAMRLVNGDEDLSPEGNEMLGWLVRRGEPLVSVARVKNAMRKKKTYSRPETFERALDELVAAGFIRKVAAPRKEGAGRPDGPLAELHPGLLAASVA